MMKSFAILGMIGLASAASAAAQGRAQAPATAAARSAIADFGRCVVARSPDKAHATLTMNFVTGEYRDSLRVLSRNNADCMTVRGTMRAGGLPFAAAMAEALLAKSATPLNVRLLRAAGTEAPTYAATDRVAMCVARSDADHTAALLTSAIGSPAEEQAAAALRVAVQRCTPAGVAVDLTPYALRAILATASYRLLAAAGGVK